MRDPMDFDYGPLADLIGTWRGDDGVDVAPERDGPEDNPYDDFIVFEPIGDVDNAEEQELVALRYHQVVTRKRDGKIFHNETGYWTWEPATGDITQTLTIPRGVSLVAGGTYEGGGRLEVSAKLGDPAFNVAQSTFMAEKAKTLSFVHVIEVSGDQLKYHETTVVDIYGRLFDHTDDATLTRVSKDWKE